MNYLNGGKFTRLGHRFYLKLLDKAVTDKQFVFCPV